MTRSFALYAPLFVLILGLGLPTASSARHCQGQTQRELNICAMTHWEVSDAELNRLWRMLKPRADAAGWGQRLLNEQRAWLKRRDAVCNAELSGGGSAAHMFYWNCMDEMTRARNREFRAMM
jgi:uncharacterized protein YecT (DUF1311 family)